MESAALTTWLASRGYRDSLENGMFAKRFTRYVVRGNFCTKETKQADFSPWCRQWRAPLSSLSITADDKLSHA
jgi:hypothetical protein